MALLLSPVTAVKKCHKGIKTLSPPPPLSTLHQSGKIPAHILDRLDQIVSPMQWCLWLNAMVCMGNVGGQASCIPNQKSTAGTLAPCSTLLADKFLLLPV